MVGEALKGGRLVAAVMEAQGFKATPGSQPSDSAAAPPSFITAVELGSAERMVAFCRAVQRSSPVGAYVQPEPGAPGVAHMAPCFVQASNGRITAVELGSTERMDAFCRAVQRSSPVGAYIQPCLVRMRP